MKKTYLLIIVIAVLIAGWVFVRFILGGDEDSWIKDEKGQYVEHGNPSETPDYIKEQQDAIMYARELYFEKKLEGMKFSSQCLGVVGENLKFAVDIVNVPRTDEDNKAENQCEDYREGKVQHFIELDKDGNIFRVM